MREEQGDGQDGWSKRRVGEAVVMEEHGDPRAIDGAWLAGAVDRVHAIRVGAASGEQVWIRPVDGRLWRRGRITIAGDRVEFRDEATATEGDGRNLPPERGEALLEAAVLASAEVRAKARTSEVYAALLYAALVSRAWRNRSGEQAELSDHQGEGLVGALTGRGYSRVAARWVNAEILDAKVLDEEVASDMAALGWTPGGV